jgi:DNA-binding response OmpR family regulator
MTPSAAVQLRVLEDPTSFEADSCEPVVVSIPQGAPPAVRHLARQIVDNLHELLAASTAPAAVVAGAGSGATQTGAVIDLESRQVRRAGQEVRLTRLEFELLAYLDRHPGRAISRAELLNAVWRQSPEFGSRTVDVHVRRLRAKLGVDFLLTTVRGFGYRLDGWAG